jgi:RHS repeat-associated protein
LSPGSQTSYVYDPANNLVTETYPNGLRSTIHYDSMNRLTAMTTPNSGYLYQLGATGNRTSATELTGRSVQWSYDGIYRLTNEAIASDPAGGNGAVDYGLDPVGNRLSSTSSLPRISTSISGYDSDDLMSTESYDANGNTVTSGGRTFAYDSENHLTSMNNGGVTIIYDGDGNRVSKTASGVTTLYLVDDLNPTGYAQVIEELSGGAVQREYAYGLQRINENQIISGTWTPSFYGYDGGGSVRQLTNLAAAVTDRYNYDAFGNLLNSTGATPNNYLYRGEQYDTNLNLYYLRARYYNPATGRFMSRDPNAGKLKDPKSLHKYLYADGNPVDGMDPSGRDDEIEYRNLVCGGSGDCVSGITKLHLMRVVVWSIIASQLAEILDFAINPETPAPPVHNPEGPEPGCSTCEAPEQGPPISGPPVAGAP